MTDEAEEYQVQVVKRLEGMYSVLAASREEAEKKAVELFSVDEETGDLEESLDCEVN